MNVNFSASFIACQQGVKDDKPWCNVTVEDPLDPMDRMRLFTRDKNIINRVALMLPHTLVNCRARIYTNRQGFLGASLEEIEVGQEG